MSTSGQPEPERLLSEARKGNSERLGALLELYRNYLYLLARTQIDLHLQGRASASDVVQETFLDACRDFSQFRGGTEKELLAWLRQVLVCNLGRLVRQQLGTQKRDARREVSLEQRLTALEQSSVAVEAALVGRLSSPSAGAERRERAALLADRLGQLPPDPWPGTNGVRIRPRSVRGTAGSGDDGGRISHSAEKVKAQVSRGKWVASTPDRRSNRFVARHSVCLLHS
jgi:RNA polymerase sigma-70 factor (ECF subfamily)